MQELWSYLYLSMSLGTWVSGFFVFSGLLAFGLGFAGFRARQALPSAFSVGVSWPISAPLLVVAIILYGFYHAGNVLFVSLDSASKK